MPKPRLKRSKVESFTPFRAVRLVGQSVRGTLPQAYISVERSIHSSQPQSVPISYTSDIFTMAGIQPPRSPTLAPPRKSIELEDPGAHELGNINTGKRHSRRC